MRNEFDRRSRNLRAPHTPGSRRLETRERLLQQHDRALSTLRGSGYRYNSPLYRVAVAALKEVTRLHIEDGIKYDAAFDQVQNDLFASRYDEFGESLHDLMRMLKKANNKAFRIMREEHEKRYHRRSRRRAA